MTKGNVTLRNSLRWSTYIIKSVDKTKLSCTMIAWSSFYSVIPIIYKQWQKSDCFPFCYLYLCYFWLVTFNWCLQFVYASIVNLKRYLRYRPENLFIATIATFKSLKNKWIHFNLLNYFSPSCVSMRLSKHEKITVLLNYCEHQTSIH